MKTQKMLYLEVEKLQEIQVRSQKEKISVNAWIVSAIEEKLLKGE